MSKIKTVNNKKIYYLNYFIINNPLKSNIFLKIKKDLSASNYKKIIKIIDSLRINIFLKLLNNK